MLGWQGIGLGICGGAYKLREEFVFGGPICVVKS